MASLEAAGAAALPGLQGLAAAAASLGRLTAEAASLADLAGVTGLGHCCHGLALNRRLAALLEKQLMQAGLGGCLPSSSPPGCRGAAPLAPSAGHQLELGLGLLCGSNN